MSVQPFDCVSPSVSVDAGECGFDALLERLLAEPVVLYEDEAVEFGGGAVVEASVELSRQLVGTVGERGEGEGGAHPFEVRRLGLSLRWQQLLAAVVGDRLARLLGFGLHGRVLVLGDADLQPVSAGVAHAQRMVSHVLSIRATLLAQSKMPQRHWRVLGPANGSSPR